MEQAINQPDAATMDDGRLPPSPPIIERISSTRTTQFYGCRHDEVSFDEVERISI
jgi:hypothetical protein